MDETRTDQPATTGRRFVAGAAATPGAMKLRVSAPPAGSGMGAHTNHSLDAIVRFAATSQPLTAVMDSGQPCRDLRADARARKRVAVAAGGRIVYHRLLDFVGADRATNKIWYPTAIYVNHTNFLKRP